MPNKELEGLFAEFHLHPVLQVEQSKQEEREVYKDEIYIQIQIKGQKTQIRDRIIKPEDKNDFPNAWERWLNKNEQIVDGNPISLMPGVGPSMELDLKTLGIRTIEDMANLNDSSCANMRGGYLFRTRAKAYLAASAIKPDKIEEDEKTSDPPVDIKAMQSDPNVIKPKRGRPRKVA